MASYLISSLLSRCSDTNLLLDELCWNGHSWPEIDRVEALRLLVEKLVGESGSEERLFSKVQLVIWEQCVPLLKMLSSEKVCSKEAAQNGQMKELLSATCALLGTCVKECQLGTAEQIASLALPVLVRPWTDAGGCETEQLDPDIAIEVLAVLLSNTPPNAGFTMEILASTLSGVKQLSEARVSKIIVRVWFTSLKSSSEEMRGDILQRIWEDLLGWHEQEGTEAVASRVLLCLVALSDYLFSSDQKRLKWTGPDPVKSESLVRVIQAGLIHRDGMSRKRALYLLKRCVSVAEARAADVDGGLFEWTTDKSPVLRKFWEDYALVLETLEEYQIHVVSPVLVRMDWLVETAAANTQSSGLIHPSWLLCIYQRMFHSENQAVLKEGVSHFLGLPMLQQPEFALAISQFVVDPFMGVLAETALYHRSPGQIIGSCPELGRKLQDFLLSFFTGLPQDKRGSVLLQLLQRVGSRHWCAVPLLLLSEALSRLTPSPLLKGDGVNVLRQVLRCTTFTPQGLLRRSAQCFLLHAALHLTDVSAVSLEEVFAFIACFQTDESLRRGSPLWEKLCDWLMANEEKFQPAETSVPPPKFSVHCFHHLKAFLSVPASSDQTESISDADEAKLLACALLLSAELDWRRKKELEPEDNGLEQLFCPLLDVLRRLNTSVYMPLSKADRSLQLMLQLLQLLNRKPETGKEKEDKVAGALRELLFWVAEPIQEFILRRLSGELQALCDLGRADLYVSVLRELIRTYSGVPGYLSNLQMNYVSRLIANSLRILTEPCEQKLSIGSHVQKAVSMATLAFLCETAEQHLFDSESEAMRSLWLLTAYFCPSSSSSSTPQCLNQTLPKPSAPITGMPESQPDDCPMLKDWGRVVANFIRDQWICRKFLQKFAEAPSDRVTFQAAIEALSLLPSDLVLPVLDFMCSALSQMVLQEEALYAEAVSVSWKLVQALGNNAQDFWPTLRAFVRLAFHRTVLEPKEDSSREIPACVKQITRELLDLSQAKPGVLNVLIQHCCQTWLPSSQNDRTDTVFESALNHLGILTEACVYGPVLRRDQRLIQEVQLYVEQLSEEVFPSENKDDQFPRLCVLAFLSHLQPSNSLHQELMQELVRCLLKKDKEISKSSVRYYSNSMQHRIKNRVWQTLLLLLPKLRRDFVVEYVFSAACDAGFCSNQASVKYLIEWALILILHQNPSHIQQLWVCFSVSDQEKTKTSICTFLSVLVHLDILLPKLEDKAGHWQKAVELILLWCFNHNFTVRLYALLALKRVWALEGLRTAHERGNAASLQGLATVVEACLHQAEAMQNAGNAKKNWTRIQEHFFFSDFHPINDYSIETIFHTFPRLSELAEDECIPVWKFERLVDFAHSSPLPVRNVGRALRELQPGDWVQQDKGELEQDASCADVQKKIAPWSLSVYEQDSALSDQHRSARVGKLTSGLVVVASLIEKPTNLGGLCRTCEIFGASALVLSSLHHIRDKQFQALSVSSELWLPMLEVRSFDLSDFLQLKQREGYSIIGVEQTANSQSLKDYRFPEKTLLLLGNEREGIPADLLQLLDVCVEIPQQGVTRSLNVHVSAALLVWEYTRQHLGSGQAS